MTDQERRGVAYHGAAHAVVASALGLKVGAIKICGEDNSGGAEIQLDQSHLPLVDRIAICIASIEAKTIFNFTMHEGAERCDYAKVIRLVEGLDQETSLAVRNKGYERARELLKTHEIKEPRWEDVGFLKEGYPGTKGTSCWFGGAVASNH